MKQLSRTEKVTKKLTNTDHRTVTILCMHKTINKTELALKTLKVSSYREIKYTNQKRSQSNTIYNMYKSIKSERDKRGEILVEKDFGLSSITLFNVLGKITSLST